MAVKEKGMRPLIAALACSLLLIQTAVCLPDCRAGDPSDNKSATPPQITLAPVAQKTTIRQLWSKYQRLGAAALQRNQPGLALKMFSEAVQEAELLNYDQPEMVDSLDSLSLVYRRLGMTDDSLQAAKKAMELKSRPAQGRSDRKEKINSLRKLADLHAEKGDFKTARENLQQALALASQSPPDEQMRVELLEDLISACMAMHDQSGIKDCLNEALRYDGAGAGENQAGHLELKARILWQEGQLSQARDYLERALAMRSSFQKPDDPALVSLGRNLIRANLALGVLDQPEKEITRVLEYDRAHAGQSSPEYLFDLLSLAELKLRRGESASARHLCEEVLKEQKRSKDVSSLDMADALSLLGRISAAQGQWEEAKDLAGQACARRENLKLPPALSVNDYETLARADSAKGRIQEVEANLQKALDIRKEHLSTDQAAMARLQDDLKTVRFQLARARSRNQLSEKTILKTE